VTTALDSAIASQTAADILTAVRVTIFGRVQGVGLRPAIARLAEDLELSGEVANTAQGVALVLEGPRIAVDSFVAALPKHLPPEARLDSVQVEPIAAAQRAGFHIVAGTDAGPIRTEVPRDLKVCPSCLAEIADTSDRRYGYPFTSCTDCGPRYSIIRKLPFERDDTTMQGFGLCPACQAEYTDSKNRRFQAQTIACPQCGPDCWLVNCSGTELARGDTTIDEAAAALCAGKIVALKGLGGYQLLVDATNSDAVARLRRHKNRPIKPLAVMVSSLAAAESLANFNASARAALVSREGPIVIVPARRHTLAEGIHPDLDCVGLMLPTTPLHQFLAERCPPLVATSGNREGEPLAWDQADAQTRLANVADCFLHHDRPIYRPVDDSVVRMIAGHSVTIRAARGLAPLRLDLFERIPRQVLAVGGQQKVAIALHNGCQAVLGPHIGDLDDLLTRQRFVSHVHEFCELYRAKPELIVHDLHPDYFTTRWAEESGLPTLAVQHHHAHIVAAMVAHGWLDREVLGVAWDGTGYGPDGTIWGGEFLWSTAAGYRRVARLRPFPLFGGEAAIREPWRVGLAVLQNAVGAEDAVEFLVERGFQRQMLAKLPAIAQSAGSAPLTSSVGRLFDAVAAWLLPGAAAARGWSLGEGHLAMLLEALCDGAGDGNPSELPPHYHIPITRMPVRAGQPDELDWRPLIAALLADFRSGHSPAILATRFHEALAEAIVRVAALHEGIPVVLSGGVFQNRLLTEAVSRRLAGRNQPVGLPGIIPPGDGGLAAGQLAVAIAQLQLSHFARR
jgi:hydrogenase maturation protein HypF